MGVCVWQSARVCVFVCEREREGEKERERERGGEREGERVDVCVCTLYMSLSLCFACVSCSMAQHVLSGVAVWPNLRVRACWCVLFKLGGIRTKDPTALPAVTWEGVKEQCLAAACCSNSHTASCLCTLPWERMLLCTWERHVSFSIALPVMQCNYTLTTTWHWVTTTSVATLHNYTKVGLELELGLDIYGDSKFCNVLIISVLHCTCYVLQCSRDT